ncbi:MAG TPA: methyltransferase domain-containing protein [Bacteroidia bacterium]|nr:methyltransferase domain-containing protein [Bacteroidia bacterium]
MRKRNEGNGPGSLTLLKDALENFTVKGFPADKALNETFRKYKVKEEFRRSELARRLSGIIRFWRPIISATGIESFSTVKEMDELVSALIAWKKITSGKPPGDVPASWKEKMTRYLSVRKMRESVPDWLDELGVKELGEEKWNVTIRALNKEPMLFLRTNTLLCDRNKLIGELRNAGIQAVPAAENGEGVLLEKYENVFRLAQFHEGWFEVQDISSQLVGDFCKAEPGMRVADACAGNGGKTLHLGALMNNRGKIVAMDVSAPKLAELRNRCTRAHLDTVETRLIESGTLKKMEASFDRVLVDAPCTGSGVLRRNPDAKWRLQPEDISPLLKEQQDALENYSPLVKKNGFLIYSTCSVFPSEGEMQVQKFLSAHPGEWEKEEEMRIDPEKTGGDGFYMARLKRI